MSYFYQWVSAVKQKTRHWLWKIKSVWSGDLKAVEYFLILCSIYNPPPLNKNKKEKFLKKKKSEMPDNSQNYPEVQKASNFGNIIGFTKEYLEICTCWVLKQTIRYTQNRSYKFY